MDKTLAALLLTFFLAFTVFTTTIVLNRPITSLIKAKEEIQPSRENSIILAWPLSLKADGKSDTTISVFIRSAQNSPVHNKVVHLNTSLGQITENDIKTNEEGTAAFHLVSNSPGVAEIEAVLDNTPATYKISVKFE